MRHKIFENSSRSYWLQFLVSYLVCACVLFFSVFIIQQPPGVGPDNWSSISLVLWRLYCTLLVRTFTTSWDVVVVVYAKARFYRSTITWPDVYRIAVATYRNEVVALAGIVEAIRTRCCRDPKDRAFAMYSVLQKLQARMTRPEYTTPTAQVLREFYVDLLRWRWSSLAMLIDAGMPCSESNPSWVPQWGVPERNSWIAEEDIYRAFADRPGIQLYSYGLPVHSAHNQFLTVHVHLEDSVAECIRLPEAYNEKTKLDCLSAILTLHWKMRNFGRRSNPRSTPGLKSMLAILCATWKASGRVFLEQLLTGRTSGDTSSTSKNFNTVHPEKAKEILDSLPEDVIALSLDRFGTKICGKRLLFITTKGSIGTGSLSIQPGDVVYRISGVILPMVLRTGETKGTFQLVGPALVSGLASDTSWLKSLGPITLA
jgi:hypothetical protein